MRSQLFIQCHAPSASITLALIALSAELIAAKVCDIKRRGGMLGVATVADAARRFLLTSISRRQRQPKV